jgi:hypothetical protein
MRHKEEIREILVNIGVEINAGFFEQIWSIAIEEKKQKKQNAKPGLL